MIDKKLEDKLMYSTFDKFWKYTGMTYTEYKEKFFSPIIVNPLLKKEFNKRK